MKQKIITLCSLILLVPFIVSASNFTQSPDMELGYTGAPVVELQKFLNANNYIVNSVVGEPGSIGYENTYFGKLTQKALSLFQTNNNITPAQGYFGPKTKLVFDSIDVSNVPSAEISSNEETYSEEIQIRNLQAQKPLFEIQNTSTSTKKVGYVSSWYPIVWNMWTDGKIKNTYKWDTGAGTIATFSLNESDYAFWEKNAFFLGTTINNSSYVYTGRQIFNHTINGPVQLDTRIQNCAEKSPKHVFFKDANALEKKLMQFAQNKGDSKLKINANGEVFAFAIEYGDGGICAKFIDVVLKEGSASVSYNTVASFYNSYKGKNIKNMFQYHSHDFNSMSNYSKINQIAKNILIYKDGNYYSPIPSDFDLKGSYLVKLNKYHTILGVADVIERVVSADGTVYEYDQPKSRTFIGIYDNTDITKLQKFYVEQLELIQKILDKSRLEDGRQNYNNKDAQLVQAAVLKFYTKGLGSKFSTYNVK